MICPRRPIVAVLSALVIGAAAMFVVGSGPASALPSAQGSVGALQAQIEQQQLSLERERSELLATRGW